MGSFFFNRASHQRPSEGLNRAVFEPFCLGCLAYLRVEPRRYFRLAAEPAEVLLFKAALGAFYDLLGPPQVPAKAVQGFAKGRGRSLRSLFLEVGVTKRPLWGVFC